MRITTLGLILFVLLDFGGLVGLAAGADGQPVVEVERLEKRIHALVNQERKKAGLPALAWEPALQQIARGHSRAMVAQNFFAHTDPAGRTVTERYRQAGFHCAVRTGARSFSQGGENLAQNMLYSGILQRNGRTTKVWNTEEQIAAAIVTQWMASAAHRRNILTRHYQRQGIGVAIDEDGKVLVTENFC